MVRKIMFFPNTSFELISKSTVSDLNVSGDYFSGPHKLGESDFRVFCKLIPETVHQRMDKC